jgi:hypothetical protein
MPETATRTPDQATPPTPPAPRPRSSAASTIAISSAAPPAVRLNDTTSDQHEQEAEQAARAATNASVTSAASSDASTAAAPSTSGNTGSGQPLSSGVRSSFERAYGWNFSGVRLHAGSTAAQSADQAGAKAYTAGRDIVFGSRIKNPEAGEHRSVLAHELAHVIQQDKRNSSAQASYTSKQSGTPQSLAASLSAAPAGQAQALPLVTAVAAPGELGVGRQIRATATVAAGAGPLTWALVGAPAGVTLAASGRIATIRSAAAPNPHPAAGTLFTVRAARTAAAGDNATVPVRLVGIANVTMTPAPPFAAQPIFGGGNVPPPAAPVAPALGGVADPNRGGLAGNTVNVVVVTAPAGRANTITLARALSAAVGGTVITPGATTGNATVRVTDNLTSSRLDVPLAIQSVPLRVRAFGGQAAVGPYGAQNNILFQFSDAGGTSANRAVGETITAGGRDDFGFTATINSTLAPPGPNPAPDGPRSAPANGWFDNLLTGAGAVAGAAGDANMININRYVGPGAAAPLPRVWILRQGFHFRGWGGVWSNEIDHGIHRRSLIGTAAAPRFRTEHIFPGAAAAPRNEAYAGPPLIVLSAVTVNTAAAPAVPLAAGGLAADGAALAGVTVATTVAGRQVNWSVLSGPLAFNVPALGVAAAVGAAAVVRAGLVPGTFRIRVADSVFANRRAEGNVRIVAVRLRGIAAPVRTVPAGTLTAIVNLTADPGGRVINWTVDPAAAAAGVTVVGTAVAGAAAAAVARSATVTRPAGFTGSVTVTAVDAIRPAARTSITITFR